VLEDAGKDVASDGEAVDEFLIMIGREEGGEDFVSDYGLDPGGKEELPRSNSDCEDVKALVKVELGVFLDCVVLGHEPTEEDCEGTPFAGVGREVRAASEGPDGV